MRRAGPVRRFAVDHPRVVDAIVVGAYLVPAVTGELVPDVLADGGPGPAERATVAAVVVLTALALWWRRTAPVRVLTATTVLLAVSLAVSQDTTSVEIAAVLALYAVAAYRPTSTAWGCLALLNVVSGASLLLWMDVTQETAVVTTTTPHSEQVQEISQLQALVVVQISVLVLSVVAVALGTGARGRRLQMESLLERTRQLVLERDQREQLAVSAERTRIAREMHDVVAHSLSVMITLADGASAAMSRQPDQAREALEQLAETGRSALADTRRMVGVLREDSPAPGPGNGPLGGEAAPLSPQPAAHDLADLVERFRVTGLPVRLTESGPPLPDDAGLQLTVYRIVQECLTNVLRYARLSPRIDVTVERLDGRVVVTVDNDSGTAGDAILGSGRGLIGIRERAAVYDGHVEAGPTPTGWRVRAELGWSREGHV